MRTRGKNTKGIMLLLFLGVFSFFAVKISDQVRADTSPVIQEEQNTQVCQTCGNAQAEETIVEEPVTYSILQLDKSQTVEITNGKGGSVLGISIDCSNYAPVNMLDSVSKLCSSSSGVIDHDNSSVIGSSGAGIKVGKDTTFELVTVTYPLAFWLGQYVYENSNKEIKRYTPEYKSNGEQIDEDYQAKTLAPQEADEFRESISGTVREDFLVTGQITVGGADREISNPDGEYVVQNADHDPKCNCPKEVAVSDYNVGKSNYIASDPDNGGYYRQQIPGGDTYDNESGGQCLEEGKDYKNSKTGNALACIDILGLFEGFFSEIFSSSTWTQCTVGEEVCTYDTTLGREVCRTVTSDDCISTKDIGVKMTPIFGDPYECTTELCANAFLTYAYKGTLSPDQAAGKKIASSDNDESLMFFVGTPCTAKVDTNGRSQLVPVTCLWDASPTLLDYKLQAKDKIPSQESFPQTYGEYWSGVEVAIDKSSEYYGLD